jgi:hypothetical protein
MSDEKVRRHATVYIDRERRMAIVVSVHRNGAGGVLVEDGEPRVLTISEDRAELGAALQEALKASTVRPAKNLRDLKRSEWPAYQSSGRKSVKAFEADFIRLDVSGANEANVTYVIEGSPEQECELRVRAAASAAPGLAKELAEKCLLVWQACRDRRF